MGHGRRGLVVLVVVAIAVGLGSGSVAGARNQTATATDATVGQPTSVASLPLGEAVLGTLVVVLATAALLYRLRTAS